MLSPSLPNRPDLFQVKATRCDSCLFTPERLVPGSRAAQIIKDCESKGTHFICHKGSLIGHNICCREFFDRKDTLVVRLALALGKVVFVEPAQALPCSQCGATGSPASRMVGRCEFCDGTHGGQPPNDQEVSDWNKTQKCPYDDWKPGRDLS